MGAGEHGFILGVDLDGVCADFFAGMRKVASEWLEVPLDELSTDVSWDFRQWGLEAAGGYEALHRFAVVQRDLFRHLDPIPHASVVLRRLSNRGVRIRVVTQRLFIKHFHLQGAMQTIEWLDNYDFRYWDLCFLQDKTAVGADLFVEDAPKNIEMLRASGVDTICFANSTNKHIADPRANDWNEVEALVMERFSASRT